MSSTEWAQAALQTFDQVVQSTGGFRDRAGQRSMAEQVARTFSSAQLGKPDDDSAAPVRAIAVIQAGTGVGKSLAYCAPAIALVLARGTRVLISTSTIAGGRIDAERVAEQATANVSIHARHYWRSNRRTG